MQPWVGRVGMFLYYYYYMYFFLLLLLLSTASSSSTSNSFQQPIHAIYLWTSTHFPISHFPFPDFPFLCNYSNTHKLPNNTAYC